MSLIILKKGMNPLYKRSTFGSYVAVLKDAECKDFGEHLSY